jgi:hypothetical protein
MRDWFAICVMAMLCVTFAALAQNVNNFSANSPKQTPKIVMTYSSEKQVEFIDEHGKRLQVGLLCIYIMPGANDKYSWQLPYVQDHCPKYITIIPSD